MTCDDGVRLETHYLTLLRLASPSAAPSLGLSGSSNGLGAAMSAASVLAPTSSEATSNGFDVETRRVGGTLLAGVEFSAAPNGLHAPTPDELSVDAVAGALHAASSSNGLAGDAGTPDGAATEGAAHASESGFVGGGAGATGAITAADVDACVPASASGLPAGLLRLAAIGCAGRLAPPPPPASRVRC